MLNPGLQRSKRPILLEKKRVKNNYVVLITAFNFIKQKTDLYTCEDLYTNKCINIPTKDILLCYSLTMFFFSV